MAEDTDRETDALPTEADAVTSSRRTVWAALLGNLLVATTKAIAAVATGSSAMTSEALHSFLDTGNEVLLLYGQHRARQPPDRAHPLGHGRELYFWSFLVALLIFAIGAGASVLQGVLQVLHPEPIRNPWVSYVVLGLAFGFEGSSWIVALRHIRREQAHSNQGLYESFRRSKDPPAFMVLFEDSAALLGILIAALGTFVATERGWEVADGIASILIGAVLAAVAVMLARESKSLLIGETASHGLSDSIRAIAARQPGVARFNGLLSAQLGPDQILVALSIEFSDDMRVPQLEECVVEVERQVRAAHPEVVALFIKPQTASTYGRATRERYGPEAG